MKDYIDPQIMAVHERIAKNNRIANKNWDDFYKGEEVLNKQLDALYNKVNEHTKEIRELRTELDAMRREKAAYERGLQAGHLVDSLGQPLRNGYGR